jgi:probable HAF family extracellular repeat protein
VSYTAGGALHAFFKSPGKVIQDLGLISGSIESHAPCINNAGTIGGYYVDSSHFSYACIWVPAGGYYQMQDISSGSLSPSEVHGINAAGYIVGRADSGNGLNAHVRFPSGAYQDLGMLAGDYYSEAMGINNGNTIVGNSYGPNGCAACFWSPSGGGFTAAAALDPGMTNACAINNLGQAVGYNSISFYHAVLKSPGEALQDLGALLGEYESSLAYDLNDSGWVVGWFGAQRRAFLWTPAGGMQDLNTLVVNLPPGVTLMEAHAINNRGEIAGYTTNGVFKLTPIRNLPFTMLLLN